MAATGGSVAHSHPGRRTAIDAVGWGTRRQHLARRWASRRSAGAARASSACRAGPRVDPRHRRQRRRLRRCGRCPIRRTPGRHRCRIRLRRSPTATPVPDARPWRPRQRPGRLDAGSNRTPGPTPTPAPAPIADRGRSGPARRHRRVTVEGDALTGSDFHDGGGFLADASGGIAVLARPMAPFARGQHLASPARSTTASRSAPCAPSGRRRARDRDRHRPGATGGGDGIHRRGGRGHASSNPGHHRRQSDHPDQRSSHSTSTTVAARSRVVVGARPGSTRPPGRTEPALELVGVAGQRDSSGTGSRRLPRAATRRSTTSSCCPRPRQRPRRAGSPGPEPTPPPRPPEGEAVIDRRRPRCRRTRGPPCAAWSRLPTGIVDGRLGGHPGRHGRHPAAARGRGGQLSLRPADRAWSARGRRRAEWSRSRVSAAPGRLGTAAGPAPRAAAHRRRGRGRPRRSWSVVRGALVASARTAAAGRVSFEIDDGSGPLRDRGSAPASAAGRRLHSRPAPGSRSAACSARRRPGAQPLRGYRVWPRDPGDVRIMPPRPGPRSAAALRAPAAPRPAGGVFAATDRLPRSGEPGLADLRVGATLVCGRLAGARARRAALGRRAPRRHRARSAAHVERPPPAGRATPLALELLGLRAARQTTRAPASGWRPSATGVEATGSGSAAPTPPSSLMPAAGEPPQLGRRGRPRVERSAAARRSMVAGASIADPASLWQGGRLPGGDDDLVGRGDGEPAADHGSLRRCIVPAPTSRCSRVGPRSAANPPDAGRRPRRSARAAAEAAGRRLLAAALLRSALAVLGAAVLVYRRFHPDEPRHRRPRSSRMATDDGASAAAPCARPPAARAWP